MTCILAWVVGKQSAVCTTQDDEDDSRILGRQFVKPFLYLVFIDYCTMLTLSVIFSIFYTDVCHSNVFLVMFSRVLDVFTFSIRSQLGQIPHQCASGDVKQFDSTLLTNLLYNDY